jgi:hypothetical protein
MCRRIACDRCGKPTFAGCGRHVEQVLGDVPRKDRCRCADEPPDAATPRARWWSFFK